MNPHFLMISTAFVTAFFSVNLRAAPDQNNHIYLLFGQSNMAGGGAGVSLGGSGSGTLITADCDTSPRVKVLAFCNCSAGSIATCTQYKTISRTADKWYTASPALHSCNEGVSPGDWFAKTMLDSIRPDISIGLIPCALSGQALNVFSKGGSNFNIPTWAHPTLGNNSPYAWMLARCILAQQTGVIKGILLHQGESGAGGSASWINTATTILDNLKKDLGLDSALPVVVGELRSDTYASFNTQQVDQFAKQYPHCGLATSTGLAVQSDDQWHFDAAGMRELGKRFAKAFLSLASEEYVPRKGSVNTVHEHITMYHTLNSATGDLRVYSINGRAVGSYSATNAQNALRKLSAGGLYIVSSKLDNGHTATVPFVKE